MTAFTLGLLIGIIAWFCIAAVLIDPRPFALNPTDEHHHTGTDEDAQTH